MSEAKEFKQPTSADVAAAMASQSEQEDVAMFFRNRARQFRMALAVAQEQNKELVKKVEDLEAEVRDFQLPADGPMSTAEPPPWPQTYPKRKMD